MDVLVTGGAGFIGSSLVRELVEAGDSVRVLDDLSTGSLDNLSDVSPVDWTLGDVRDREAVTDAASGAEIIFHFAALPSVARSVANPMGVNSVNVEGTLNVLTVARDTGVRRVIYASSSSVYGDAPSLPKREDMAVCTLSPYAASKFAGESYCRAFTHVYGLETVSLRFFNVFGPRQDPASEYAAVIPRFATAILRGEAPVIFGDGSQSRDFTFIANVADACRLAAVAGHAAAGESMNIACGERITLLELIEELGRLAGARVTPTFVDVRPGDVKHSLASIEKAERLIGYRPSVTVRLGLDHTMAWFREHLSVRPISMAGGPAPIRG